MYLWDRITRRVKEGEFFVCNHSGYLGSGSLWDKTKFVQITEMESPVRFVDEVIEGPFQYFKHTHEFVYDGADN